MPEKDGRFAQRDEDARRQAEEQAKADAAVAAVEAAKAERVRNIAQNEVGVGAMERELSRSREQEVERVKAELAREEEAKAQRKAERARRKAEEAHAARAAGVRNNAWTGRKSGQVTQEVQLQQRLNAAKLVVAAAPPLDVAALREVLLTMDSETRDVRALAETKVDKRVVVYRHEIDEWIDRRCMILLQPVIDDLKAYKERTDPRIQALEDEMPPLKARISECEAQLRQHRTKIGNLSARLLKAETALIEKAEQTEVNALAEATRRFMQKTGKTLTAHEGPMGAMKETAESNRVAHHSPDNSVTRTVRKLGQEERGSSDQADEALRTNEHAQESLLRKRREPPAQDTAGAFHEGRCAGMTAVARSGSVLIIDRGESHVCGN